MHKVCHRKYGLSYQETIQADQCKATLAEYYKWTRGKVFVPSPEGGTENKEKKDG